MLINSQVVVGLDLSVPVSLLLLFWFGLIGPFTANVVILCRCLIVHLRRVQSKQGDLFPPAVPLECRQGGDFGGWTKGVTAGWIVSSADYDYLIIIAAKWPKAIWWARVAQSLASRPDIHHVSHH